MWCVTQQNGCPIAETNPHKVSNLSNMVSSIVRRESSFVTLEKSVINFSVACEKEHGMSFLSTWMVDNVEDMVSSDLLTGNSFRYTSDVF